jgi:hypothetical protein
VEDMPEEVAEVERTQVVEGFEEQLHKLEQVAVLRLIPPDVVLEAAMMVH